MPARWLIPLTLSTGVLAGFGIDTIRTAPQPWGKSIAILIVVIALMDDWSVGTAFLQTVVQGEETPITAARDFRQSSDPAYARTMYSAARANLGVLSCYETVRPEFMYVRGYVQAGYRGEQYLLGAGTVALNRWTPNELSFEIDAPEPTTLVVNQNFVAGWRIIQGQGTLVPYRGLIAVLIPAGRQHLELSYGGWPFRVGLLISILTLAAIVTLWNYEFRHPGQR